ncbi:MAG: NfeD family protein [Oscillospiraceae bacterium]|nr:NfeD family protein [Oscillospiraceae bacterium]
MYTWMIIWGVLFAVTVIAELSTMQLVCIWFAAGSLGAFLAAAAGLGPFWQIVIFTAISVLLLIFTRPLLKKLMVSKVTPTNLDAEIGRTAVVIEEIDPDKNTGRVKLGGVNWRARTDDGCVIPVGTIVRVERISGTTAFVTGTEQPVSMKQ